MLLEKLISLSVERKHGLAVVKAVFKTAIDEQTIFIDGRAAVEFAKQVMQSPPASE